MPAPPVSPPWFGGAEGTEAPADDAPGTAAETGSAPRSPAGDHPSAGAGRGISESHPSLANSRLDSLGEVVAGVAHELNNPLTAILGYAEILGGLEGRERDHALHTIEDEAQRAARIVRNLLSFARQRPGQRRLVNLEEVLRRVIDLRRYALEMDEVHVVTRFGMVPDVVVDEGQFEQVFLHLLSNAQQALQARGGEVAVTTWEHRDHVYVSFADDGPGVPEAMRERIFEPFFTTQEIGRGQGMGLAIVYGVVTQHGGRAWVEGGPSGGATFVIEVPVPKHETPGTAATGSIAPGASIAPDTSAAHLDARPSSDRAQLAPGPGRCRVLVVDDEGSMRALAREILAAADFEVETVESGEQALRLLAERHYDVLITTLRTPEMDGARFYRSILDRWPAMRERTLVITGDIESGPAGAPSRLDLDGLRSLQKPFTGRQLLAAVEEIVGERTSRA